MKRASEMRKNQSYCYVGSGIKPDAEGTGADRVYGGRSDGFKNVRGPT